MLSETQQELLKKLREWIKTQDHLPQNIEDMVLLRFLKTENNDIELTKKLLSFCLRMRAEHRSFFTNRDFLSPEIQNVLNICDMLPMIHETKEKLKVIIYGLADGDSSKFAFDDVLKTFYMVSDIRLIMPDPDPHNLSVQEINIFDAKHFSIWHLFKLRYSSVKLFFNYSQTAIPIRTKQTHLINCGPVLYRLIKLCKPLMLPEVAAMQHFHEPNSETLFDFVPKELIPKEYGGTGGSTSELKKHWNEIFIKNRDYIMNDSNWIVDTNDKSDKN